MSETKARWTRPPFPLGTHPPRMEGVSSRAALKPRVTDASKFVDESVNMFSLFYATNAQALGMRCTAADRGTTLR